MKYLVKWRKLHLYRECDMTLVHLSMHSANSKISLYSGTVLSVFAGHTCCRWTVIFTVGKARKWELTCMKCWKVFRNLYFLNHWRDFYYTQADDRYNFSHLDGLERSPQNLWVLVSIKEWLNRLTSNLPWTACSKLHFYMAACLELSVLLLLNFWNGIFHSMFVSLFPRNAILTVPVFKLHAFLRYIWKVNTGPDVIYNIWMKLHWWRTNGYKFSLRIATHNIPVVVVSALEVSKKWTLVFGSHILLLTETT